MWWETYPARAHRELRGLRGRFPDAQVALVRLPPNYCPVCRENNRRVEHLCVFARVRTVTGAEYPVVMVYPCDFPNRIPRVWPLRGLDPPPPNHQYLDGRLCLTADEHDPAIGGVTVLGWAYDWLTCYEVWRRTGVFPGRNYGRHLIRGF